jgi:hypothetical protein
MRRLPWHLRLVATSRSDSILMTSTTELVMRADLRLSVDFRQHRWIGSSGASICTTPHRLCYQASIGAPGLQFLLLLNLHGNVDTIARLWFAVPGLRAFYFCRKRRQLRLYGPTFTDITGVSVFTRHQPAQELLFRYYLYGWNFYRWLSGSILLQVIVVHRQHFQFLSC